MANEPDDIEIHYGRGEILNSILAALKDMGKDPSSLTPADLAPVDEFHIRGREATLELASMAAPGPGMRALDIGCGLGGSVRHVASEHGCQATGIDLTREYIEAGTALAKLVGLDEQVELRQGSALNLPFSDASFDIVWTEHTQMNIADKQKFYSEIARVLAPGGRLVFHDIFQGPGGTPYYPVPWAEQASLSKLVRPEEARRIISGTGLKIVEWINKTADSLNWINAAVEKVSSSGPPRLGIHLLMGSTARTKLFNLAANLGEGRIEVVQAMAEKPD